MTTDLPTHYAAMDDPGPALARLDGYRAAVHAALDGVDAFDIDFEGIAPSRGALPARGIPRSPALEDLRDRLRGELQARGLAGTLDRRYRLVTAHATLFRFISPLQRPARFASLLDALRDKPLGGTHVDGLELVINDWYMARTQLERVALLGLGVPSRRS